MTALAAEYLPLGFGFAHAAAIVLILALWGFYTPILGLLGRGSLNSQLHSVRLRWFEVHQDTDREHRVFDAILLGHISNSISYFGSGTLLVLAGLVGALANVNNVFLLTRGLAFTDHSMSLQLFTLCVFLLTAILAQCFFSFTYALRKMAYTFAMLGGLQSTKADSPQARIMGEQSAVVLTEAVRSINTGIRGYYYAVAALFLFAGPWACIAATLVITALLYYRQLFSPTAVAIARYVDVLKSVKG
ncbi:MAG: DUF599 family protein [Aestuariivirga sp.]|uniref:DUF599 domain-containing protein n=1 Tax=Aestuariivirga sp. TaxID=2650926 RepID=UPI0025BBA3B2|nr:DUF599 family protein [Aestuariivirga sp.]MCA3561932.1 DUF599 family protein [Aestuariivirga sp.]